VGRLHAIQIQGRRLAQLAQKMSLDKATVPHFPGYQDNPLGFRRWIGLMAVIFVGLFFRLYSFHSNPVINPDGTLYIQQAKAIHYGLYGSLTSCYHYISSYPILIALCNRIIGDWVVSASTVSLIFSISTLVPLYLLLRRFFNGVTSNLTLLVFSVMPRFVIHSHSVIRGPIFWFFSALGMYLFVRHMEKKREIFLLIASLSFVMATWARVEGILFLFGSAVYLCFAREEKKLRCFLSFMLPVMLLGLFIIFYATILNRHFFELIPYKAIFARLKGVYTSYHDLLENLRVLDSKSIPGFSPYFFGIVRNQIWLIALGAVVRQILRTFSYPFFLLFVIGTFGLKDKIRRDSRLAYLTLLATGSLGVLYMQAIFNWAVHSRHIALFLFPSFVLMGFGIIRITEFLTKRLKWKDPMIYATVFVAVVCVTLPGNLETDRGANKLTLREIGEFIAHEEGNARAVTVAGGFKRINLVHFYANEDFPGAPCFSQDAWLRDKKVNPEFLRRKGFDYYIWDEKTSSRDVLKRILKECPGNFVELGRWISTKKGQMVLFKVKS
jgi:4-amino-4-deoxy-L-arabinose transferase-like glycosyltransferase